MHTYKYLLLIYNNTYTKFKDVLGQIMIFSPKNNLLYNFQEFKWMNIKVKSISFYIKQITRDHLKEVYQFKQKYFYNLRSGIYM